MKGVLQGPRVYGVVLLGLVCLALNACRTTASNPTNASLSSLTDATNAQQNADYEVLKSKTPRALDIDGYARSLGYAGFPAEVYARKGTPTAAERTQERMPRGNDDSAAHRLLTWLGQQAFQQALLARKSGEVVYADNALLVLKKVVAAKLRFTSEPRGNAGFNDNRFLTAGWYLSLLARGARILDRSASEQWKSQTKWHEFKDELNAYIGTSIDQRWPMEQAPTKSMLDLAAHPGTMNWVGRIDTNYGATNRTFAMLEAQLRVAEFRDGKLGPVKLVPNAWQLATGARTSHDGSVAEIFETFRGYLRYFFNRPLSNDRQEFVLKYSPGRSNVNADPEKPDTEPCGDPRNLGYRATCRLNKDAYRNDTYHPLMGLASVVGIIEVGKRFELELTREEHQMVIEGLRWAAFNNVPGITGDAASRGIDVWEVAFRIYSEEELGPYCKAELMADRAASEHRDAGLAWGYSLIAEGF